MERSAPSSTCSSKCRRSRAPLMMLAREVIVGCVRKGVVEVVASPSLHELQALVFLLIPLNGHPASCISLPVLQPWYFSSRVGERKPAWLPQHRCARSFIQVRGRGLLKRRLHYALLYLTITLSRFPIITTPLAPLPYKITSTTSHPVSSLRPSSSTPSSPSRSASPLKALLPFCSSHTNRVNLQPGPH